MVAKPLAVPGMVRGIVVLLARPDSSNARLGVVASHAKMHALSHLSRARIVALGPAQARLRCCGMTILLVFQILGAGVFPSVVTGALHLPAASPCHFMAAAACWLWHGRGVRVDANLPLPLVVVGWTYSHGGECSLLRFSIQAEGKVASQKHRHRKRRCAFNR